MRHADPLRTCFHRYGTVLTQVFHVWSLVDTIKGATTLCVLLLLSPSSCLAMLPSTTVTIPSPSPAHPAPKTRRRPLIRPLPDTSTPRRLPRTPTHREPALPIPRRRQRLGTTRGPGRSPAVACVQPAYLFRRCRSCTGPSYLHSPGCGPLPRSGADAVLLSTTDSGGYDAHLSRAGARGLACGDLGREEVGTDCTYYGDFTVIVL
jgi:hypothetical protein